MTGHDRPLSRGVLQPITGHNRPWSGGLLHPMTGHNRPSSGGVLHQMTGQDRPSSGGVLHRMTGQYRPPSGMCTPPDDRTNQNQPEPINQLKKSNNFKRKRIMKKQTTTVKEE
ncbi:hypothetical protein PGTUg99_006218 [Puccinia graminis f. sp. tritici]|uniref:Uncharacterized protein n=1 Tax=Puccinia graminis f. sp. tritici TaxID=56615 RepID=A0A5B0PT36_PUCGR|nr:hypothetical protein PGTUg99_006218 [Puccinia graminis f. sp. tritici]